MSKDSTRARRGTVHFVSLGCPKNQVDTEVMLGVVREEGLEIANDPAEADTLVVNTCGFIEEAKAESIDTILELARIKQASSSKKLVVTGCLSQRYAGELAAEMPEVDHFLGSADMLKLRDILRGQGARDGVSALSRSAYLYDHETPRVISGRPHTTYLKIAEGCDRPCAFCIIPKLRGPQRSRTIESLVEETEALVAQGAREIGLIAQDLTTYGSDRSDTSLEQLLDALGSIDKLAWLRLHYAFPTTTSDGLLDRIAGHEKVATYLDVPLQHVDTEVLRKMRRGYGEKQVRSLVERLRDRDAYIWLRTTMLVGHPGESEAAFSRLSDFVGQGYIDHLGVFPWSREEGTPAAMLPGRIEPELAHQRAAALLERQETIRRERFGEFVGETMTVMIDGPSDESEYLLEGRHEGQAPGIDGKVIVCDGEGQPGDLVRARITAADAHDLVATCDLDRPPEA